MEHRSTQFSLWMAPLLALASARCSPTPTPSADAEASVADATSDMSAPDGGEQDGSMMAGDAGADASPV
jgi:hypothetical protein